MAKPSLIELVNAALVSIGQEPVVSLETNDASSSTVVSVKALVYMVKRELLRSNDWNCARTTAKLAKLKDGVNRGWQYAYVIPEEPECLRIVQISVDDGETFIDLDEYYNRNNGPKESLFDVDGTILLSNADSVYIKYIADIDPAKFDPTLASAFVAQLATELSYALPASVSLAEFKTKDARKKLRQARALNALERNVLRPEGEVIGIRFGSDERRLRVDMSDELGE
jgi:hypothetical protein